MHKASIVVSLFLGLALGYVLYDHGVSEAHATSFVQTEVRLDERTRRTFESMQQDLEKISDHLAAMKRDCNR